MAGIAAPEIQAKSSVTAAVEAASGKIKKSATSRWASLIAIVVAVLWTIPTFGLLVTSFRPQLDIGQSGWWTVFTHPSFTLDNYKQVLSTSSDSSLLSTFVNSIVITIPCVIIPTMIALLAAYALAWVPFKGRNFLFVCIFALQVVPLQIALLPLLKIYVKLHLINTLGGFTAVWLSHTIFALPLAIFLIHNFMSEVPRELVEAARVDGAGHVKTLFSVMMPLLTPALAAFAIFQFLWVWNDLLVGLTFAGGPKQQPITVALANLSGTQGTSWYLLSAGAFVSIAVPVAIFLGAQRYFVRGLLAGSVKG